MTGVLVDGNRYKEAVTARGKAKGKKKWTVNAQLLPEWTLFLFKIIFFIFSTHYY